jgi:hypothetical protein
MKARARRFQEETMESGAPGGPVPDDEQRAGSDAGATSTPPSPTAGDAAAPAAQRPAMPPRPAVSSGARPSGRSPGAGWWIGAVLVAAVLGVGGYLLGHSAGENAERDNFVAGASGYEAIYQQGVAAGTAQGTQRGQAQGAAAGKQVGFEEGEQTGSAQGEQAGLEQGERQGMVAGASAALGGFSAWEPGTPYVVKVQAGTTAVPYEIDSRTQLQPNTEYALCQDDPTQVCTIQK